MTSHQVSYDCSSVSTTATDAHAATAELSTQLTPATNVMTSQERRFWAKVNKDGPIGQRRPELGPCWMWTGTCYTHKGAPTYGQFYYNGRRMSAHRAAFLMAGGTIPDGYEVMHLCDTKRCARYSHLMAGTHSQNMLDGFANPANAGVCAGPNNGRARLTWDDVHAIRAARKAGALQPDLATKYGVAQAQISFILSGRRWPESKCPIHGAVSAEVAA